MEEFGKKTLQHIKVLCKPRQTGTTEEFQTRQYIAERLRALGYKVTEESFQFQPANDSRGKWFLAGLLLLCGVIGLASYWEQKLFASVAGLGLFLYGLVGVSLQRQKYREAILGKTKESVNLLAAQPGNAQGKKQIILCAHYDSKSHGIGLRTRVFLATGTAVFCFILALSMLIQFFQPIFPRDFGFFCAGIIAIFALPLIFSGSNNLSPGACKNALALCILLELAERFRLHGSNPEYAIRFLFLGAKEEGNIGAIAFLRKHFPSLQDKPTEIINLEILGASEKLCIWSGGKNNASIRKKLHHLAAEERIPIGRISFLLGFTPDHMPFHSLGIPAMSLTTPVSAWARVHTEQDTPKHINDKNIEQLVRLLDRLLGQNANLAKHPLTAAP